MLINTYAITLSSLLIRPVKAPTTSWEASGSPRELMALTARWIWVIVESSLTAARRMSRVSLDTGIYEVNKNLLVLKVEYQWCPLSHAKVQVKLNAWHSYCTITVIKWRAGLTSWLLYNYMSFKWAKITFMRGKFHSCVIIHLYIDYACNEWW